MTPNVLFYLQYKSSTYYLIKILLQLLLSNSVLHFYPNYFEQITLGKIGKIRDCYAVSYYKLYKPIEMCLKL